jgi:hypothetical protein
MSADVVVLLLLFGLLLFWPLLSLAAVSDPGTETR